MRKSKKAETEKSRRGVILLFLALLFLAAITVLALLLARGEGSKKSESYIYNGFVFERQAGLWFTEIQRAGTAQVYRIPLHFGPLELENISLAGDSRAWLSAHNSSYITFDPGEAELSYVALAAGELAISMARILGFNLTAACTANLTKACASRPIVSCGSGLPVIYLEQADQPEVIVGLSCIRVRGKGAGLVAAVDRLLLAWFGIML